MKILNAERGYYDMNAQQAIEELKGLKEHLDDWRMNYSSIDLAIEALQKQIAVKPTEKAMFNNGVEDYYLARCPSCETHVNSNFSTYCRKCGQYLDWED
jgi:hypothetical protein